MIEVIVVDNEVLSIRENALSTLKTQCRSQKRKTGVRDKNQLAENAETCYVSEDSEPSGNKHLREVKEQNFSFFCSSSSTFEVNYNTTNIM